LNAANAKQIESYLKKFRFYTEYLEKGLPRALNVSRWTKKKTQLDKNYFDSSEYKNQILKFNAHFIKWSQELENNKPSFAPFDKIIKNDDKRKNLFKYLDTANCLAIDNAGTSEDKKHHQLLKLFSKSTQKVIETQKL
jgi:hypothetical protein